MKMFLVGILMLSSFSSFAIELQCKIDTINQDGLSLKPNSTLWAENFKDSFNLEDSQLNVSLNEISDTSLRVANYQLEDFENIIKVEVSNIKETYADKKIRISQVSTMGKVITSESWNFDSNHTIHFNVVMEGKKNLHRVYLSCNVIY